MKTTTKLWIGLGALAVLSPIGLYLPEKFKAGSAWGEWSSREMHGLVGYVPKGLEKFSGLWKAPLHDYAFKGWENLGLKHLSLAYIVSAIVGIGLCVGLAFVLGKILSKKERTGKNQPTYKAGGVKNPAASCGASSIPTENDLLIGARLTSQQAAGNALAKGFIERTIEGTVSLLRETVSVEIVAARNGFLQRRDPRFKCLSAVLVLVTVLISKNVAELSVLYLFLLALVGVSSIGLWFFLERTLLFVPIFSLFIALPAIFNVVTPGEPLVSFKVFSWAFCITRPGVDSAIIFFMRVLDSVSIAVLLVITTRQHVLLKVLRVFRVPQLFVMTMGMTYRYVFLFLDIIQKMFIAIKSRVGFISSSKTGRHVVTANIAGLWLRSYRLQSQVYDAMVSRGYAGEALALDDFTATAIDFVVFAVALCALIGTLWLNRFFL